MKCVKLMALALCATFVGQASATGSRMEQLRAKAAEVVVRVKDNSRQAALDAVAWVKDNPRQTVLVSLGTVGVIANARHMCAYIAAFSELCRFVGHVYGLHPQKIMAEVSLATGIYALASMIKVSPKGVTVIKAALAAAGVIRAAQYAHVSNKAIALTGVAGLATTGAVVGYAQRKNIAEFVKTLRSLMPLNN